MRSGSVVSFLHVIAFSFKMIFFVQLWIWEVSYQLKLEVPTSKQVLVLRSSKFDNRRNLQNNFLNI